MHTEIETDDDFLEEVTTAVRLVSFTELDPFEDDEPPPQRAMMPTELAETPSRSGIRVSAPFAAIA
jgi:hypothetical protein